MDAEPTAEALAGRASVNNKLKNFMEAAADASRAVELNDKLAAAHKEKGCVLPDARLSRARPRQAVDPHLVGCSWLTPAPDCPLCYAASWLPP